jgi:MFS family permease
LLTRAANSTASQMTQLHMVVFFILAGYGELQAAVTIGLVGLLSIGGRPIFGSLSDFIGREITYTVGLGMTTGSIIVVLLFGNGGSLWPLVIFVALAGLSDGISGLVVGAKAADLFPSNALGTVMGVVEVGRGVGIALGGLLFDLQGDYLVAFFPWQQDLPLLPLALCGLSGLSRERPTTSLKKAWVHAQGRPMRRARHAVPYASLRHLS